LEALRNRESSTIKRLLSAPADRFVEKFQIHAESYPRRAVCVATTNDQNGYWQDPTGARRLVPIECGEIRVDLIAANRLQWLAEARHRYDSGATWWEFPAEIVGQQQERQMIDPWEDTLRSSILNGIKISQIETQKWPTDRPISTADILAMWLHLEPHQQTQAASKRLGPIMRSMGFTPARCYPAWWIS